MIQDVQKYERSEVLRLLQDPLALSKVNETEVLVILLPSTETLFFFRTQQPLSF